MPSLATSVVVSDAVADTLYCAATPVTGVETLTPTVGLVMVCVLPEPVNVGVEATEPVFL